MSSWRNLRYRFFSLLHKRQLDKELDEELRFCLEMETEANIRRGMSPEEARRAARIKLGGSEQIKEVCRDERGFPLLESFVQDVRHGWRSLLRAPLFATVVVLILALGIGFNTAMFSVVKAVLLDPLPYPDAEKLVWIHSKGEYPGMGVSLPNFKDIKDQQTTFEELAGWDYTELNLTGGNAPRRVTAARFMPGVFDVAGVPPLIGNPIRSEDEHMIGERVVLLSFELWRSVFGGDNDIVGREVLLDDEPYSVHSVMPQGFGFPGTKDVWIPWDVQQESWANRRDNHLMRVVARISPDVSVEEAQTELDLIWQRLAKEYPENKDVTGLAIQPELERLTEEARVPLLVLMAAVVLFILVVAANLSGLLLSRGLHRHRELTLRAALGASRFRIARQLLTETLLLCLPGWILGLILAHLGVRGLVRLFPTGSFLGDVPRLDSAGTDSVVVGFALLVTFAAVLVTGLIPAVRLSKPNIQTSLKDGVSRMTTSSSGTVMRDVLTISQIALSLLLLLGSALLFISYRQLASVDLGFLVENRLTAQTVLSGERYPSDESKVLYWNETTDRLRGIPGALEVTTTSNLAFSNWGFMAGPLEVEGRQVDLERSQSYANYVVVGERYFELLGISVLRGRELDARDLAHSESVMVINRELEALLFPDGGAQGNRVKFIEEWRTVVGVVDGVRRNGPLGEPFRTIYVPYTQYPTDRITWVLKTAVSPETLAEAVRIELSAVDAAQPVFRIETLEGYFHQSISKNRLHNLLMSFFAMAALAVACLGLYGVLAFRVALRTHEIGIRRALGASRPDIFAMIIRRGMLLVMVGLILGNVAALGLTRFLSSMLFGVGTRDATTFFITGGVFLLVGFAACALPALRAVRLDPSRALRYE